MMRLHSWRYRSHWWDFWARLFPPRALRPLALPLDRNAVTDDGIRWESTRALNLIFAYLMNEGIAGDYAEFGVLEGRTFREAWLAANRYGLRDMRFHAYDSFEGLPEVKGRDTGGPFHQGQFASPRVVFDHATQIIPPGRKTVTEGFFDDSLPASDDRRDIAVAWVDCDLYDSTVPVLEYLTPRIVDGGVIVFDDWFCFKGYPDRGEQRACNEWLERNPEFRLVQYRDFHWAGRSFLVHRLGDAADA